MSEKQELVVREFLDALAERNYDAALGYFAPDAVYHVSAWHPPVSGVAAIAAELDRQSKLYSAFSYELRNIASVGPVVFTERLDSIVMGGRNVTLHWASVHEFDADGRIAAIRDYYDIKELESQLAP